jgi:hypothetical protein
LDEAASRQPKKHAAKRVQCDEIWSFVGMKEKAAKAKAAKDARPANVGDVWTWTAIDADSKLIVSWLLGGRDAGYAWEFMTDVASRLANRVQLTTDAHKAYLTVVPEAFGFNVDYAQIVKLYGADPKEDQRRYSPAQCLGAEKQPIHGYRRSTSRRRTSAVEPHRGWLIAGSRRRRSRRLRITRTWSLHVLVQTRKMHKTVGADAAIMTQRSTLIARPGALVDRPRRRRSRGQAGRKPKAQPAAWAAHDAQLEPPRRLDPVGCSGIDGAAWAIP